MIFAPFKLSMLPMRFILFGIFIFVNWYIFKFFIYTAIDFDPEISYFALSIWAFLCIVWFWSYVIVCWLDAGSSEHDLSKLKNDERKDIEKVFNNKCSKCGNPKPPKTHHCSKCDRCYGMFDHHCFIVGNCIAYRNAQPFVIFLIYGDLIFLYCSIISFFSKSFYSTLNSTITLFMGIVFAALTYCLFLFARLSYDDYSNGRTAFERVTHQSLTGKDKIKLHSIFPIIGKDSPFLLKKSE